MGPTRPLLEAQGHLATWKEVSSGQGWQDGAGDDRFNGTQLTIEKYQGQ